MDEQLPQPRQGLRGCLTIAGALTATGLLALALVAASVGAGLLAGPSLELGLGEYYLVARITEHPACLPIPSQCFIPRPTFTIPQPRYYAVWAGRLRPGRNGAFAIAKGRLLLRVSISPAPPTP